ncbi:MAG: hypothetical protein U1F55_13545 [Chitinivorax sp.]|jgi:hypothetical protein
MKNILERASSIRRFCEIFSTWLFVFFWAAANAYWVISVTFLITGKALGVGSTLGGILGAIGVFMAFLVPFWVMLLIGTYYLATLFALISFRPVPFLLCSIAWLDWNGFIPPGHITIHDVSKIIEREFNGLYPLLYSILAMLGALLVGMAKRRV